MQNGKVIDADGHVFEHSVDWAERLKRLDPPYNNRAPKWVKDDWGRSRLLIEGRLEPIAYGPGQGSTGPFAEGVEADRLAGSDPVVPYQGNGRGGSGHSDSLRDLVSFWCLRINGRRICSGHLPRLQRLASGVLLCGP